MTCKQCTAAAKSVDLALDDEELYHRLAALQTYGDYANLIANLEACEAEDYGAYSSSTVSRARDKGAGTA